ncbi:hypothetical protein INT47_004824 [Mucor saturninus]|uniref:Uncharacterized protein n=1 Tax=Mucor saturninus TaxID=64648 RepID=A0A8H7R3B0_9FUNG|nr:hypothetical protein INT47_004824 [Mucor saturninus]
MGRTTVIHLKVDIKAVEKRWIALTIHILSSVTAGHTMLTESQKQEIVVKMMQTGSISSPVLVEVNPPWKRIWDLRWAGICSHRQLPFS